MGLERQEAFKLSKPNGDQDDQIKKEVSVGPPLELNASSGSVVVIHSENIVSQAEQSIVKELIGDQGKGMKQDEDEEKK